MACPIVSEIEMGARRFLSLISFHHPALECDVAAERVGQRRILKLQHLAPVANQELFQVGGFARWCGRLDDCVLDHFGPTLLQLPRWEGAQEIRVDQHQSRLNRTLQ